MSAKLTAIVEAVGSALLVLWGIWVEWRLHLAQAQNEMLRREYNDKTIEDENHSLSDDALRAKLNSDVRKS
jgi:ABC-type nickel/cobalt efflux system permease component RcnA